MPGAGRSAPFSRTMSRPRLPICWSWAPTGTPVSRNSCWEVRPGACCRSRRCRSCFRIDGVMIGHGQGERMMQPGAEIRRYGIMHQFLHWMTVVLVVVAWTLGLFGDDLPKGAARATGLFVHISAGLLVLGALVLRLVWRVVDPPPPTQPNRFGGWLGAFADPAARLAHLALYALLIA